MALIPFESNPEVMGEFLQKAGVPSKWTITDVYSLDPDVLAVIPRPVLALILLYPISEKTENFKKELESKPQDEEKVKKDGVYHLKQSVSNVCGTIALIHGILNNIETVKLEDGFLKKFYEETKDVDFEKRGEILCKSEELIEVHRELSLEGQTEVPDENNPSMNHFVVFVEKNGTIYELDGRKPHPINHGKTTTENFLEDAAKVVHDYMKSDPEDMRFSFLALTAAE